MSRVTTTSSAPIWTVAERSNSLRKRVLAWALLYSRPILSASRRYSEPAMSVIYILWLRELRRYVRSRAQIVASLGQPVMYLVAGVLIVFSVLVMYADIVKPITLPQ